MTRSFLHGSDFSCLAHGNIPCTASRHAHLCLQLHPERARTSHRVTSLFCESTSSTVAGLSAVQALYSLTDQIIELHRLDNTIKSTFGQQLCSPLENSVRPYQQEMSRMIATHPWHLAGHATSAASHGCRVRTPFSCRTHIHRNMLDHS